MNKQALSEWVAAELEGGTSMRQLGLSLGVAGTTIAGWRDQKMDRLSDESLQAIAFRRKESIQQTAVWLGVEPPYEFDMPARFADIERRLRSLEGALAYQQQQKDIKEEARDRLHRTLIQNGVDIYQVRSQEMVREAIEQIGAEPVLFERFLLGVLGVVPFVPGELAEHAKILRKLTGNPWTAAAIEDVVNQ